MARLSPQHSGLHRKVKTSSLLPPLSALRSLPCLSNHSFMSGIFLVSLGLLKGNPIIGLQPNPQKISKIANGMDISMPVTRFSQLIVVIGVNRE